MADVLPKKCFTNNPTQSLPIKRSNKPYIVLVGLLIILSRFWNPYAMTLMMPMSSYGSTGNVSLNIKSWGYMTRDATLYVLHTCHVPCTARYATHDRQEMFFLTSNKQVISRGTHSIKGGIVRRIWFFPILFQTEYITGNSHTCHVTDIKTIY